MYVPFSVATDGNGQVTDIHLVVQRWLTGASPHTDADRFSYVFLIGGTGAARNNLGCHTVGISPGGTPDTCLVTSADSSESRGVFSTPGVWSMVSVSIPTLSPIALLLLALGIAAGAWTGGARKLRTR
ncbi:MAG: IPTL-CTERM sorting domain-containing protein [Candidatus Thiodiazotropha sp.]